MACYGYPWPEILNCNKFPADHELCIAAVSTDESSSSRRSKGFFFLICFPMCNAECSQGRARACGHRTAWVGRELKDHKVPA